jgi:Cof subfamily protein (haloacid dehalogenase superfamily)
MPLPYDLVLLDVDGTILHLTEPGGIRPAVRAAIRAVQDAGIPVSVATGRTFDFVLDHLAYLDLEPVVTTQGAVIGDPVSGCVLEERTLGLAPARALAAWADATERLSAFFFIQDHRTRICQNIDTGDDDFYDHIIGTPRTIVGPLSPLLAGGPHGTAPHLPVKHLIVGDRRTEPHLAEELQARFGPAVTVARTHPFLVEVTAHGVDKGTGTQNLLTRLGVDPQRVLAIGDNDNDVPMMQIVGTRIAMGNGTARVKAIADWVAPPLDADGAAVALRRFVLGA